MSGTVPVSLGRRDPYLYGIDNQPASAPSSAIHEA
jgi:hypothetical protein